MGPEVLRAIVPGDVESIDARLVQPTAQALRIWRRLGLEVGEAAIYTGGHELSDIVGLVASWHGAMPVVCLRDGKTPEGVRRDGVDTITVRDAAEASERLRSLTANAPGVAAVDLCGNGAIVSVLLETLPRWGRLLFAGPSPDPFTTAFYTDIHRKGAQISAGDVDTIVTDPASWEGDLRNARRLLAHPTRAAAVRASLTNQLATATHPSGIGT